MTAKLLLGCDQTFGATKPLLKYKKTSTAASAIATAVRVYRDSRRGSRGFVAPEQRFCRTSNSNKDETVTVAELINS